MTAPSDHPCPQKRTQKSGWARKPGTSRSNRLESRLFLRGHALGTLGRRSGAAALALFFLGAGAGSEADNGGGKEQTFDHVDIKGR